MSKVALFHQVDAIEVELRDRAAGVRTKRNRSSAEIRERRLGTALATLRWLHTNQARVVAVCGDGFACGTSLTAQIGAVKAELDDRTHTMSRSVTEFQIPRLEAAAATLRWMQAYEISIKRVMAQ